MKKEILDFIDKNLELFKEDSSKTPENKFFKTRDAKAVFNRTINKISENFVFLQTKNIWRVFPFTLDIEQIKKRQEFFRDRETSSNEFLEKLQKPRQAWKPKYGIIVVTDDEKTFTELKELNCPIKMISSEYDLEELSQYDIVQAVNCESSTIVLETLPQSVFLDSAKDAYLERFLEHLSGWKNNLEILKNNNVNKEIKEIVDELFPLLEIIKDETLDKLSREKLEKITERINGTIEEEISKLNISGMQLVSILNKGKLPEEIEKIKEKAIKEAKIPEHLFNPGLPVSLNESETEKYLKLIDIEEHTSVAEKIKKNSEKITKIPKLLKELSNLLILFDFKSGVGKLSGEFPKYSEGLYIKDSKNLFLENSQAISFHLDEKNKCSILTGANSGGKTTLIEHIIQLITLFQLGLPCIGTVNMPIFSEIYYFAKNKGETGKGAFENLLGQMDKIQAGKKTLILADEIESVTEPGVAGRIISATCEFFVQRGCFLVVATHLGQEIQKNIPSSSRIDGIEAKGLDEYFELIVDHNPVLGKLASSTPELIIEKLASLKGTEYYKYLHEKVKKSS